MEPARQGRFFVAGSRSGGVVEDDAEGETGTGTQPAYSVPERDAVVAADAGDGAVVHGEDDGLALRQRYDLGA